MAPKPGYTGAFAIFDENEKFGGSLGKATFAVIALCALIKLGVTEFGAAVEEKLVGPKTNPGLVVTGSDLLKTNVEVDGGVVKAKPVVVVGAIVLTAGMVKPPIGAIGIDVVLGAEKPIKGFVLLAKLKLFVLATVVFGRVKEVVKLEVVGGTVKLEETVLPGSVKPDVVEVDVIKLNPTIGDAVEIALKEKLGLVVIVALIATGLLTVTFEGDIENNDEVVTGGCKATVALILFRLVSFKSNLKPPLEVDAGKVGIELLNVGFVSEEVITNWLEALVVTTFKLLLADGEFCVGVAKDKLSESVVLKADLL